MANRKLTKYHICAIFGLCLSVLGAIFLKYIIPPIVNHDISKRVSMKDGSPMRKIWSEPSFSHEFHAYVFNVTNPDEILKGEKPIVKEVGPFIYDVKQEKIGILDHEEDDTLSYTLKKTFIFNASKSQPLSHENELTLVHYLILGPANAVLRSRPALMPIASKSVDSLYNKPKSIFVKVNVKTYLFDGYDLNCVGAEEFFAKAGCNDIAEFWYDYRMHKIEKDFYKISAWGTFNDTLDWTSESRINRGVRDIKKIGEFVSYNNTNNFAKWEDEKCNAFLGTDGTMFRPFLNRNDNLHVVNTWLSRSFIYRYDSDVTHSGIQCFRYTATVGTDSETNPDDKCYCLSPDNCLKNGVFEVWKAVKWPQVISNPHFYLADPYYNDRIIGLKPDKEKHMSIIDVHPLTGSVVSAKFRMQFNAPLTKQLKYRLLKNVSDALLPLGWYEERFTMPERDIKSLKKLRFTIMFKKFFTYLVIGIGLVLFGARIGYDILKNKESKPSK